MSVGVDRNDDEYSLLEYLSVIRKRWPWVLLPVLIIPALALGYSAAQPDRYEAEAQVLLAETAAQRTLDPGSQSTSFLSRELSNEISLAFSDKVVTLVQVELDEIPEIVITTESEADVLVFRSEATTAREAANFANTWAEKYVQVKQEDAVNSIRAATASLQARLEELRLERQELRAPLDSLDERIGLLGENDRAARLQRDYDRLADDLRYELELVTSEAEAAVASLSDLRVQSELSAVGEARIIQLAAPPTNRSNTSLTRSLAVTALLGLIVGGSLALLAEVRDTTIKSAGDIQEITDLAVLASVPLAPKRERNMLGLATQRDPEGIYADAFHKLRSSLEFVSFENDVKSVIITSPNPAEGKSTTSSNLAIALSSVGKRTALVDLDFRRATIHKIYGIDQTPGLSDLVLKEAEIEAVCYIIQAPEVQQLTVIPSGSTPPSSAAFVGTGRFIETLKWLKAQSDMVVFDAPPLLAVSDAHTLGRHVDAVVLTAMAGRTKKAELLEVISGLRQVGANLLGVVLLGVDVSDGYYGKQYYYRSRKTESKSAKKSISGLRDSGTKGDSDDTDDAKGFGKELSDSEGIWGKKAGPTVVDLTKQEQAIAD